MSSSADDGVDPKANAYIRSALEATSVALKTRIRELTDELEAVKSQKARVSGETQDFVAYATAELKVKDDTISELRARVHDIEFARDVDMRRLQQQMEAALDAAISSQRSMEAELRERLRVAEAKLEKSRQYVERRDELETRIEELQAALEAEREAHRQAFVDLERKYLTEKSAMIKAHEAQYQDMRKQARADAQRSLDADTKRVLLENKQMGEELRLQADEARILAKERTAMAEQARLLAREVEIYADKEREWARQGSRKTQDNRALLARIKELETALSAERTDKEVLEAQLRKQMTTLTDELRMEVEGLRSLLRIKNYELQGLKRAATLILSQRNDVETYFLQALTEVKAEVAARMKATAAARGGALSPTPTPAAAAAAAAAERSGLSVSVAQPAATKRGAPGAATVSISAKALAPSALMGSGGGGGGALTLPQLLPSPGRSSPGMQLPPHAHAGGTTAAASALGATKAAPRASLAAAVRGRVDVRDLTPDDRLAVLRLLFAKINSVGTHTLAAQPAAAPPPEPAAPQRIGLPFGLAVEVPELLNPGSGAATSARAPAGDATAAAGGGGGGGGQALSSSASRALGVQHSDGGAPAHGVHAEDSLLDSSLVSSMLSELGELRDEDGAPLGAGAGAATGASGDAAKEDAAALHLAEALTLAAGERVSMAARLQKPGGGGGGGGGGGVRAAPLPPVRSHSGSRAR